MHRQFLPVALATLMMVLIPGRGPATKPVERTEKIDALAQQGAADLIPTEVALARELASKADSGDAGDARRADLQITLLETVLEAHDQEQRAAEMETKALQAEQDVAVQRAAYEFLVEQILSSGVASYWSGP